MVEIRHVATNGSDANEGTSGQPWLTIQHAVENVAPGDVIEVHDGTYAGARIETSGLPRAFITLRAATGANVVIDQPGPNNVHDSNLEIESWDSAISFWVIEGLEVKDAPNWGIDLRGGAAEHAHHVVIRGNHVHHNGVSSIKTGIFTAFADHISIEDNESNNNGEHGVYVSNSGDHFRVTGNLLHHNQRCGVHMNGDLSQGGDGQLSAGLVEGNTIWENGPQGCAGINMDGVSRTLIRGNLLYDNHAGGITLYATDGASCSYNIWIVHNTVIQASDGRWVVHVGAGGCTGNRVYNNILVTRHGFRGAFEFEDGVPVGWESDYNILANAFTDDDAASTMDLAEWQALGFDQHSTTASLAALFVDPAADDYRLVIGSPAIDAGVRLPIGGRDIDGSRYSNGAGPDVGSDES